MKDLAKAEGWIVLDEENRKRLQKSMLSIAADIFALNEKYDLHIYLGGGSALGAVRHEGFIPWDDDIDLNIPRKYYNIFITKLQEEYGEKYWIHTPQTAPERGQLLTKIREKNTVLRGYEDYGKSESGIYVDVFVVENTFDNPMLRKLHEILCFFFSAITSCSRFFSERHYLLNMIPKDKALYKIVRTKIIIGRIFSLVQLKTWVRLADKVNSMCKDDSSKYVTIPTGAKGFHGEFSKRELIENKRLVNFEGRKFPVYQKVERYLMNLYGENYLSLPPENQREQHAWLEVKF